MTAAFSAEHADCHSKRLIVFDVYGELMLNNQEDLKLTRAFDGGSDFVDDQI